MRCKGVTEPDPASLPALVYEPSRTGVPLCESRSGCGSCSHWKKRTGQNQSIKELHNRTRAAKGNPNCDERSSIRVERAWTGLDWMGKFG